MLPPTLGFVLLHTYPYVTVGTACGLPSMVHGDPTLAVKTLVHIRAGSLDARVQALDGEVSSPDDT